MTERIFNITIPVFSTLYIFIVGVPFRFHQEEVLVAQWLLYPWFSKSFHFHNLMNSVWNLRPQPTVYSILGTGAGIMATLCDDTGEFLFGAYLLFPSDPLLDHWLIKCAGLCHSANAIQYHRRWRMISSCCYMGFLIEKILLYRVLFTVEKMVEIKV